MTDTNHPMNELPKFRPEQGNQRYCMYTGAKAYLRARPARDGDEILVCSSCGREFEEDYPMEEFRKHTSVLWVPQ